MSAPGELDPPATEVRRAVARALEEDLGIIGDITTMCVVVEDSFVSAEFTARADGVLAGTACATETYRQLDPTVAVEWTRHDGEPLMAGQTFGVVRGNTRSVLTGERVALNFLGQLSGVATYTRRCVRAVRGQTRVLDTRKTVPGLRALQRAAVRAGGGCNHRDSLSDAVLLKDNHLAVLGIARAVERARAAWPGRMVEVECDDLEQLVAALEAGADRIMLDNMTVEQVRKAVEMVGGARPLEYSGRVSLETIAEFAATGVDFISIGGLTHSASVLDVGLDFS
ncbi:MAG TPA: carboxylating nicotinate-nucleotide diphosphorylase [Acidimicrobiia bacterium]